MPPAKEKRALRLYVWEGVLRGYWPGMAVAIARSREEAVKVLTTNCDLTPAGVAELHETGPQVVPLHTFTKTQAWAVHGGD